MWPRTKPKRMRPVTAITTFLPMDDPKKVAARCMLSPGMADASARPGVHREERKESIDEAFTGWTICHGKSGAQSQNAAVAV